MKALLAERRFMKSVIPSDARGVARIYPLSEKGFDSTSVNFGIHIIGKISRHSGI